MGSKWKIVKLKDVLGERGYIRGPFGSALRRPELKKQGIPVYEQQHAITGTRVFRFFIDEDKYKALRRFTVQEHDLIVSCSGTLARISVIRKGDPKGIISQALLILRPDTTIIEPAYLYYFMSSTKGFNSLVNVSTGSVQVNIAGRSIIENIDLPLPPFSEQKAIAHILGSLDDKIELNRQMNKTLEAMARAIFKSWFIDFDPVIDNALRAGNPIPDSMAERAEIRRQILDQNQPSSPGPFSQREKGRNYRGGFDFSGLIETSRSFRENQTSAEALLWDILRNRQFMGLKFRRQHQIGDYIADFYCHEHRLVVELDGGIHSKKQEKDAKRDAYMQSLGLSVLRFPNDQVFADTESVLEKIAESISPLPTGEGLGEGFIDGIYGLFPDSFEDSELGEIPKGWEVVPLSEVLNIIGGGTPKTRAEEYWGGDIPWFSVVDAPTETDIFVIDTEKHITKLGLKKSSTKMLRKGTTIISARGTVGKCALVGSPMAMNQSCYGIQGKNAKSDYFLYFTIKRQVSDLQRSGHGSVFNTITRDTFKTIRIACPPTNLTTSYREVVHPLMELVLANLHENATLTSLRDVLLPKLFSGELCVPDAEKFVEEAAV